MSRRPAKNHGFVEERSDTDIAAAAVRALEWDAFVPIDKLDVTVSQGWITWAEREEAARQAWAAPGVTAVDNRITIAF